jgi:hypothetical protein
LCAAIVDRLTVGGDIIETYPRQPSDARVHRHDRPQRSRRQNSGWYPARRGTGVMTETAGVEFFCYHRDRPGSMALREELLEEHWS